MQLRGRPSHVRPSLANRPLCGSSLCSRCSTSEESHTYGEEAMRLRTARSAKSARREREGARRLLAGEVNCPSLAPTPCLYRRPGVPRVGGPSATLNLV